MINGTSVMTGIAANCIYNSQVLLSLALAAHALYLIRIATPYAAYPNTSAQLLRVCPRFAGKSKSRSI